MPYRCLIQQQAPVPGSAAEPVRFPMCEWLDEGNDAADAQHPLNRFVCAWLTSDVNTVEHCHDVLAAVGQVASGQRTHWAVDGDAFNVDVHAQGVQFNFSHVGPEDEGWWNLPQGRFALNQVREAVSLWLRYLQSEAA